MKKKAAWKSCPSEVHKDPQAQDCSTCAPRWDTISICPRCKSTLKEDITMQVGQCPRGCGSFDTGTPATPIRETVATCVFPGCENVGESFLGNYCPHHFHLEAE